MLTNCIEGSTGRDKSETKKCEQYWPSKSGEKLVFGAFEVINLEEEKLRPETIKRSFFLRDRESRYNKNEKTITQLHYVGWPDYGAPEVNDHIVNLVKDVREIIQTDKTRDRKCNVLVHCSAGVGRTGTFIALYQMMEEIEEIMYRRQNTSTNNGPQHDENQKINIFTRVFDLRTKRVEMVQSWAQYSYLYASVAAYARQLEGSYDLAEEDYVVLN